ncbi:hypothetical protein GCK72_010041 [Caenorhabditis remanei]|uniref:Uncharacterized protein n=1 Tax=Caenorhabditis remanei TaxID=31234 RepID=A0A6A5H450_CAERE|nr:hypothetical protein GCK72_010041 [Caenorhabditis remanei]KAF1761785.1 hypothetical protein GCK72_010041 [Caenorhabditis remanei]
MSNNDAVSGALFQHLFRVFSLFADQNEKGTFKPAQAEFLIDELLRELRRQTTPKVHILPDNVTFNEFLNLLQVIFPDREDLQIATDRVFERYVNHVIGKGFVLFRKLTQKRRGCLPIRKRVSDAWQFGWLQVMPGIAKIRKQNTDIDDIVQFDEDTVIETPVIDGDSSIWSVICSSSTTFQFSHLDPIMAQLFVKDMRTARDYPTREELARFDCKRSLKVRPNKEGKIRIELEKERSRLESELEEEKKNRKDEEIVRGLTTRLLKQEMEKSEQMQQVIYELRSKLVNGEEGESLGDGNDNDVEMIEDEISEDVGENEEISITLPSREEKIQQYAYHLYATQAEEHVTSDDEEIWKQNYNLIVSTQSV